jgi:hypothetical protein
MSKRCGSLNAQGSHQVENNDEAYITKVKSDHEIFIFRNTESCFVLLRGVLHVLRAPHNVLRSRRHHVFLIFHIHIYHRNFDNNTYGVGVYCYTPNTYTVLYDCVAID